MKYDIQFTTQLKKDLKLAKKSKTRILINSKTIYHKWLKHSL